MSAGFLFGLHDDTLHPLAPVDADVPAGLTDALHACLVAERSIALGDSRNTLAATLTSVLRADNGQLFQVAVLNRLEDDGSMRAAGALALRVHDEIPAIPRWDYILALSTVLEQQG